MALELEILSPGDKPALIAFNAQDYITYANDVLTQLGYKVHIAASQEEFMLRFGRFQYEVIVLEDTFGNVSSPQENVPLTSLQSMPMAQRRHATVLLIGDSYESMDSMQAFQNSVHAVVNRADTDKLPLIIQQVMNDNNLFLHVFRDVQSRIAQGVK